MKQLFIIIAISALAFTLAGQNIPRANFSGPYGVQVNTYNGNLYLGRTDLVIPNQGLSITLSFSYNSYRDTVDLGYGRGWTFEYAMRYYPDSLGIVVEHHDGRRDLFRFTGGTYVAPKGVFDRLEAYQPNQLRLTTKYGMKYYFDDHTHKQLTKIEDPNGNTITLGYSAGRLGTITDASGRKVNLSWAGNRVKEITDDNFSALRKISFIYDAGGHLLSVTNPLGGVITYQYDPAQKRMVNMTNENGDALRIFYDAAGAASRLVSCISDITFKYNPAQRHTYVTEANPGGDQTTTYAYDDAGRLIQKTGGCCGYNVQYQYDNDNNVSLLTDANNRISTASHDSRGNPLLVLDPNAAGRQFTYDNTLNRLTGIRDKRGNNTTFQYDTKGNLTGIHQPVNVNTQLGYDARGNIISITDGEGHVTTISYNANNDVTGVQYEIGQESYTFDNAGNLTGSTDGNNLTMSYEYDALNRLHSIRDHLGYAVSYEYDAASNQTKETDPNGNIKTLEYDAHRRLTKVKTPTTEARYGYDRLDNLSSVTDGNQHTTTYRYNARSLLVEETDPLGNKTTYAHDGNGNVTARTDPNGQTTTYEYDALNRLVRKSYAGNTDHYAWDNNGNLIACSNNWISLHFTYDALNRMTSKTVDNWGKTIYYEYDRAGNRTKMTDPDGGDTYYTYDGNNRLVRIRNPKNQETEFIYDLGGRITEQRNFNGTRVEYAYDGGNRLTALSNRRSNNGNIARYTYNYDKNGNRIFIQSYFPTNFTGVQYHYDADNRLTGVDSVEQYGYDGAGNRTQMVRSNTATTYAYDAGDRLQNAGDIAYQYDNNGNRTIRAGDAQQTTYEFDGENRLVRVLMPAGTEVLFRYDPFGNRISQTLNGVETRYVLDGDNVLLELDAAGATTARYTSALTLDSWISMDRGGQSYAYHTDGLGSIVALTNANQNVVQTYTYDAFGNLTASTGNIVNPYRYTGREYDTATGLYYYRTRYYDAEVGRYISIDKKPGRIQKPSSLNRYTYVESNPINYVDPYGEEITTVILTGLLIIDAIEILYQTYANIIEFGWKLECYEYDVLGLATGKIFKFIKTLKLKELEEGIGYLNQGISIAAKRFNDELLTKGANAKVAKNLSNLRKRMDEFNRRKKAIEEENAIVDLIKKGIEKLANLPKFNLLGEDCRLSQGDQLRVTDGRVPSAGIESNPPQADITIPIVLSLDPNEIIGPAGYGPERWVSVEATLPYTVLFENDPDFATAPAQKVVIEHYFDNDLNPFTFRLGDFGFGSYYFQVPDNVSYYNNRLDLTDSLGLYVDVLAGVDVDQKRAFWIFQSIDPASGLSATLPAESGFLPVNDSITRAGEGFVRFTVQPWNTAQTGNPVNASASIVFDDNPPIATNVATNTLDADRPESAVTKIDSSAAANCVYTLHWNGSDKGAGLATYTLHVSAGNGPFLPKAGPFTDTVYAFNGSPDSVYRFFTIARDHVGLTELPKYAGEPSCMELTVGALTDAAAGAANGSVTIAVSGSTGALTYSWLHDANLQGPTAANLPAGVYTVVVTDAAGCMASLTVQIKSVVGITNPAQPAGLSILRLYPVPTTQRLNVEFNAPENLVLLEIFNTTGQRVLQQTLAATPGSPSLSTLEVSAIPAGFYVLRLRTREGMAVNGVFVKK